MSIFGVGEPNQPLWIEYIIESHLSSSLWLASLAPLQEILEELAASGAKDVYVDGGETIRGFLDAGLLSRTWMAGWGGDDLCAIYWKVVQIV